MNELRIIFTKKAEGDYTVQLVPGWSGSPSEPIPFGPFLTDSDYDNLRWYLEDFIDLPYGGSLVRAQRLEANLAQWGRTLYDALFKDGDNRELLNYLQSEEPPRLLTLATRDPVVLHLPWELMAESRGPLFRQDITIRRQLETAKKPIRYQTGLPLRILYVVSRPIDLGFIDPRLSTRSMLDALAPLGAEVRLDFCRPPTLTRLEEMLRETKRNKQPYHIVHFDGHATFLPEIDLGALCFERPDGAGSVGPTITDFVRADRMGELLADYEIPLVILEACRTGTIGKVAVFRSIAPRLIESGVGSVISMSHAVHVEAARVLLERFYRELITGLTVGQALEQGRAALIANPHRWVEYGPGGRTIELKDWHIPHLYERGLDLSLVPAGASRRGSAIAVGGQQPATTAERPFDVFLSHQHSDSARVERLALELKIRFGLRVWLDKWECGPGPLHDQCVQGVAESRFTLLAVSRAALNSKWVAAEQNWARAADPQGWSVIPLVFEDVPLPADLQALHWQDFREPAKDTESAAKLAELIAVGTRKIGADASGGGFSAAPGRFRLATRDRNQVGAFPPTPIYGFQGRAHELYELERQFRSHRAVLLHAMGGMGKTALAGEAAHWWTRTGLFPDGACFLSFEQPVTDGRIIQVLGVYLEGNDFNARPADQQRQRAKELFQQKNVLMVWDNFEGVLSAFQSGQDAALNSSDERNRITELYRDWTDSLECRGRLLLTCRPEEAGLPGVRKNELRGLARPDSLWLLMRVMETAGVDLNDPRLGRDKLDQLLNLLADHPLSIELVGPHLKRLTPEEICTDFGKLLVEFKTGEGQERNDSLVASLAFSTRRLSEAAQKALPWLGIFSVGVFEHLLLKVCEIPPSEWETVREELEATALIRVERDMVINDRPYLRFHPTLRYTAARNSECQFAATPELRRRFICVYGAFCLELETILSSSQPRHGLEALAREEANYRTAVGWAVNDRDYTIASELGKKFSRYLKMSGRWREREAWVAWLADEVREGGFSQYTAEHELEEADSIFAHGHPKEAIQKVQSLIEHLHHTTTFDKALLLAIAQQHLGGMLHASGRSAQAIGILEEAIRQWEALVERVECGSPRPQQHAQGKRAEAAEASSAEKAVADEDARATKATRLTNLSVALGHLANALHGVGRLDEALAAGERCVAIFEDLGDIARAGFGYGLCANILKDQGRFAEADARYCLALKVARHAGDKQLEGATLQHQGILADNMGQLDRAASLYQHGLKLFQEMNSDYDVMLTYNLLGEVERKSGRLAEARTWLERSREIAQKLDDILGLAQAANNIGIVCQSEGEIASQCGDEKTARQHFEEARRLLQQGLDAWEADSNKPYAALAHNRLAQVHFQLGELAEAERHAHQAREIRECLGLKEVFLDYNNLAEIARARGEATQSVEWARKRDTALNKFERCAHGPGGLAPQFAQRIQQLSIACAQAGFGRAQAQELDPGAESALAQLEKSPAPLPDLAAFLRRLATRELPPVPSSLPPELQQSLRQLLEAFKESGQSP